MASPLIGIAAVNSLLFAAYGTCKRAISPFGELSLPQTALAGMGAGVAQSVLASPVSPQGFVARNDRP
jgi:solute carrier family 25 carnitine/acylcarnitine transporter 20/29